MLAPHLKKDHVGIASINSPMQCMMKEVCAQCLQKHVDPATGQETIVFSCFNQDQEMDRVDFPNLAARLRQNTVQEKLSNLWLDHLLNGSSREPEDMFGDGPKRERRQITQAREDQHHADEQPGEQERVGWQRPGG